MPDLTGYSRSEAIYLLKALNINYELTGYGHVTAQSIKAGDMVNGNTVQITLSE